jgi:hypothetical protein
MIASSSFFSEGAFLHVEGPEESIGYTVRGESRGQRSIDSPVGGESILLSRNNNTCTSLQENLSL